MCLGQIDCYCDDADIDDVCADCGAVVHLSGGRPVDGIVIWGNPSEVICTACAERLETEQARAERSQEEG